METFWYRLTLYEHCFMSSAACDVNEVLTDCLLLLQTQQQHHSKTRLHFCFSLTSPNSHTLSASIPAACTHNMQLPLQLQLGRQRQEWLIPIADERVGVQVKL